MNRIFIISCIITACVVAYFQWDNIANFLRRRSWRELTAIAVIALVAGCAIALPKVVPLTATAAVAQPVSPAQRIKSIGVFRTWFLRQGFEPIIRTKGDSAEILEIDFDFMTRVIEQRFRDQGELAKQAKKMGFTTIYFYKEGRWFAEITPE